MIFTLDEVDYIYVLQQEGTNDALVVNETSEYSPSYANAKSRGLPGSTTTDS